MPAASFSCPSVSEALKPEPAAAGPSQKEGYRAHSQTQAAPTLSGSCSAADHSPQPHDQSELMCVSAATCRSDRTCHFTTSYQEDAGWRPLRPPKPTVVAIVTISPIRCGGTPMSVSCVTASR